MKMKRLYLVAALALALTGCISSRKPALHANDYRGVIRVACVGDSITYGAGVENRELNCYPVVLGKLLGPRFEVRNFAVSGATLLKLGDKPYFPDKVHPNAAGAAMMAMTIFTALKGR